MVLDENGNFSLKNTLKTALTIGACFIPVAGPYIAGALCVAGAVKGGAGMIKGAYNAATADTDAEKKEALQSLGGNTLTTGLSVAGLKGSAGAIAKQSGFSSVLGKTNSIKSSIINSGVKATAKQLGSAYTNYYGSAWANGVANAKGATTMSRVASGTKEVIKQGAKGAAENAIGAGKAIKNKASETYNKISSKNGTGTADQVAHSLGKKVTAEQVQNAAKNGGELTVGKKTYTIKENGGNYSFELNKTATPTKASTKTTYEVENKTSAENLSTKDFVSEYRNQMQSGDVTKIRNLKANQSCKVNNGQLKVTKNADGTFNVKSTPNATKTTVYEGITSEQLATKKYINVMTPKNGTAIYDNGTITVTSKAPRAVANANNYISGKISDVNTFISDTTNTSGYTYTPFIADLTDEI